MDNTQHRQPRLGKINTQLFTHLTHRRRAQGFTLLDVAARQAVEPIEKPRPRPTHQQHTTILLEQHVNTRRDARMPHQCLPVLPKPLTPRALWSKLSTTLKATCSTGTTTNWAMRSIGWMVKLSCPRFQTETKICPW